MLVTGATGFVSRRLVKVLNGVGACVRIVTRGAVPTNERGVEAIVGGLTQAKLSVHEDLDFSEIQHCFFNDRACPSFYGKCVSSHHFDAIGAKCCQIMLGVGSTIS